MTRRTLDETGRDELPPRKHIRMTYEERLQQELKEVLKAFEKALSDELNEKQRLTDGAGI